jgi:hypothetical protein
MGLQIHLGWLDFETPATSLVNYAGVTLPDRNGGPDYSLNRNILLRSLADRMQIPLIYQLAILALFSSHQSSNPGNWKPHNGSQWEGILMQPLMQLVWQRLLKYARPLLVELQL